MYKNFTISVLVPAYNEEKHIRTVLESLTSYKYLDEIICINDGSTDNTYSIIRSFKKVKRISFFKNHGKAYAIAKGIKKAKGDIIVFVDADLQNLQEKHIFNLFFPLINKKYDVVIGYVNSHKAYQWLIPVSGERAYFRKDLLPLLGKIEKKGYGIELFLNYYFRYKKVKLFPLKGLKHALKHHKQPLDLAAKLTLIEGFDIFSEMIKHDDPISFIVRSYLYPFYFKKPQKINVQIKRLTKYIKKNILNN